MDDPWGSPWVDETTHTLPNIDTASAQKPVTPGKPLPVQLATSSPWADEDGFGDWAAATTTEENIESTVSDAKFSTTDWGPETAEEDVRQEPEEERRHPWFSREVAPANVQTVVAPRPVLDGIEASQDPWAGAVSLTVDEAHDDHGHARREDSDVTVKPNFLDDTADLEKDTPTERVEQAEKETSPVPIGPANDETTSLRDKRDALLEDKGTKKLSTQSSQQTGKDTARKEFPASRPSSSPSDHSQHDEVVESPRTSFEDEPKRPTLERNVSSKVKELVQLFDGLAVPKAEEELGEKEQDESDIENSNDSADEFGEFEDFEEGSSEIELENTHEEAQKPKDDSSTEDRSLTPRSPIAVQSDDPTINEADSSALDHSPVKFDIDHSLIDNMFGQDIPIAATESDVRSMEVDAVQEIFSTIEERKVWYRISRYGTVRKHNTGDEDYVRINWPSSKVREETLKVVAKWLEEDHIGGGVILGGGNRVGGMFGWGEKNGAPLTLESAFAARKASRRKSSKSRSRKSSVHSTTPDLESNVATGTRRRPSSASPVPHKKNSNETTAAPTGRQFSWSTSQPTSAISEKQPPFVPPVPMLTLKASQPILPPPSKSEGIPVLPTPKELRSLTSKQKGDSAAFIRPISPAAGDVLISKASRLAAIILPPPSSMIDEDDDWGEMVSSPALDTVPFAQTQQKGHKPAKSMTEILSPALSSNASTPPSSHKASTSLTDEALSPIPQIDDISHSLLNNGAIESAAPAGDVWASADFSFFDAPVATTATQTIKTPTARQVFKLPLQTPKPHVSRVSSRGYQKPAKEAESEEEKLVKNIIKNLPDLSYMLRR